MENSEDNPFLIKSKPKAEANKTKTVYTAEDFDDLSPVSKKKASTIGSPNGGLNTSSPASNGSNGLSWAKPTNKTIDISQQGINPEAEQVAPEVVPGPEPVESLFKPTLGNTINTNTRNLLNNGGFMQDIGGNLSGERRSAIGDTLSLALQAYDDHQGKGASAANINAANIQDADPLSATESSINSFKNLATRLKGTIPRLNIVASDVWENVLGKEMTKKYYEFEGRDIDAERVENYSELERLAGEMKPTLTLTGAIEKGSLREFSAGFVNTLTSLASSVIPAIASGGAGLFTEMTGDAIVDYNTEKAKRLGLSINDLYATDQADLKIPGVVGALSGGMELIGLKGVSNLMMGNIKGAGFKKALLYFGETQKEGLTELVQLGLETANNSLGKGEDGSVAAKKAVDRMFSKDGLESYLQGTLGAAGVGGIGRVKSLVTNPSSRTSIEYDLSSIGLMETELQNPNISPQSQTVLTNQIGNAVSKIAEAVENDEKQVNALTDTQKESVNKIDAKISELSAVIEDPSVSSEVKSNIQNQINTLEAELVQLTSGDSNAGDLNVIKSNASLTVEESGQAMEVLAEKLTEATTPQEVAEIKAEAQQVGAEGIKAAQTLNTATVVENGNSVTPAITMGDPITFQDGNGETIEGLVKEVKDNKVTVAINNDGIYEERTIDLPEANKPAQAEPATKQTTKPAKEPAVPKQEAEVESENSVASFETEKGSVYEVLPDGRTKRFKTATKEQNDPQDLTVFAKFKNPQQEQEFLRGIQDTKSGTKVYLIDKEGNKYDTNADAKGKDVKLALVDVATGKTLQLAETSLDPKIGYNVFDQRRWDADGKSWRESHIGNRVNKINRKNDGIKKETEVGPKQEANKKQESKPAEKKNETVDLDAKKGKPKKLSEKSRTAKQIARPANNFLDAVHQFFLGGNKISTEDFISHTGFGFNKVSPDGKTTKLTPTETEEYLKSGKLQSGEKVKMSPELHKARFSGKVANRSNGGIDADIVLKHHIPQEFGGEQGMDLVTEIVNTAANVKKGDMLTSMESNDTNSQSTSKEGELRPEDNYGYTETEIAELEAYEKAREESENTYPDEAIEKLESLPEISEHVNADLDLIELTEAEINELSALAKNFTDENGNLDWNALEEFYVNEHSGFNPDFLNNYESLKTIFEYGSNTARQQVDRRAKSEVSAKENSNGQDSADANGGTSTDRGKPKREESEKVTKAKKLAKDAKSKVNALQKDFDKLAKVIAKNLKENQVDLLGGAESQAIFDDKADQQKIFNKKQAELKEAQEALVEAQNELAEATRAENQIDLNLPESTVEVDGKEVDLSKTNESDDAKIIVQSIFNPLSVFSSIQKGIDTFENNTTKVIAKKITDAVAEILKTWRTSNDWKRQWASSLASSVFGGIARTANDTDIKLGLIGGKNMAIHNMGKVMKSLYSMVGNNIESLERIHVVLDPDFYQQGLGGQANTFNPNVPPNLTYNDLTNEEKLLFDEVRKNLDEIHFKNHVLGFIDKDTFDKHKGTYVPRMYDTFELPSDVQEILDTYQDQVGDKMNLNPFKKRKGLDQLSDASKNAIIRDPVFLMAKRMMELDTNSAIMTYINHINRNNKSLIHEGANPPANYVLLEGKGYGALQGKHVPSFVAEDLKGYMFVNKFLNKSYDMIKGYDRTWARQGVKKGLTVYNPFVQLGNFTSNVVFAQLSGIDFVRWFGGMASAIKSFNAQDAVYEFLLSRGLIGTDVLRSDLMPNTEKAASLLQADKAKKETGFVNKLLKPFKKADKLAMNLYGGNDDVGKINAYKIFIEQGYSQEEAVKKVYDGFQNYATVGKAWDVAAKMPVFGNPFMKFPADLMRITGNALTQKPLSTSLYLAGLYMIPQMLKQVGLSDEEDEEQKFVRENRPFIPKMDLGFINIPLVYKTKIGEVNLARYITPFFYFDNGEGTAFTSMADRFNPIKTMEVEMYGKGNAITLPFGQDPVLGTLWNIMVDTDFRGKSIQDPEANRFTASGATTAQRWENKATHALRTWIPNGALMHDTYLNAKYGEDFYGRTRTVAQSLINFAVKIQEFKDSDYNKTISDQGRAIIYDIMTEQLTIKNALHLDRKKRAEAQQNLSSGSISQNNYNNTLERLDSQLQSKMKVNMKNHDDLTKKFSDFQTKYKRFLD